MWSRGCSRVIPQDRNAIEGADVADRDPDKIKQDYPDLPAFEDYGDLLAAIRAAL